jgi:predicted permease
METFMPTLLQDLRYALRQMRRSPGFTITVVLTLALGIGANTAIFSVVNAVLRHPEGVDHPDRVAVLHVDYKKLGLNVPVVSLPDYADAASLHPLVEAAAIGDEDGFNLEQNGKMIRLRAADVSQQWFQVFGARAILGRTFSAEEELPGAAPVTVISYNLWQQQFGGAGDVIGKTIDLDQKAYRVIGVMRSDFDWPRERMLWVPMTLAPGDFAEHNRFNENNTVMVRLRPGITLAQLNAGLRQKMQEEFRIGTFGGFARQTGWSMYATHFTRYIAGSLRKPLYVLFGVVLLVLMIAAANVAGLFLARSSVRSREFAIRTALGASTARMVRQIVMETLLLASAAALTGCLAGPVLGRMLLHTIPHNLAAGYAVRMQPVVLLFTAGIAVLTALIAGVGPAWRMTRQSQSLELREGGRSATASAQKQRLRSAFVISEVAMAFLLLCGTGLFLTSLRQLQQVNPGFDPHHVLVGAVYYAGHDLESNQARQAQFVHSVVQNLSALHGVKAAAVFPVPFGTGPMASSFSIKGRPQVPGQVPMHSRLSYSTPGYLQVMRIPLIAGRWFSADDRTGTAPVVVIDAHLAHRWWPHGNPIGQQIGSRDGKHWATVIGVVGNIRTDSLEQNTSDGTRYYPFAQSQHGSVEFIARSHENLKLFRTQLQQAVQEADGTQAISTSETLGSLIARTLAGRRLIVWMLAAFAGLALLLSMIGIYGLISYITAQRTTEMGVRMALGAQRSDVLRLVFTGVLRLTAVGLLCGAVFSIGAYLLLRHVFAGFGSGLMLSMLAATAALFLAGGCAGLPPASRAASVDPMQALRNE